MSKEKLVEIKELKKHFDVGHKQILKAVDGVSFDIYKGETLGLVGESGCGKTTLGRTLTVLYKKTAGNIFYKGENVDKISYKEFAKKVQMIFQDPQASLNPRMTVGDIIAEGLDIHEMYTTKEERNKIVFELLEKVGLNREHASRFPHEFSGGQRQRIGIARALAIKPEFIVCDEPISALDVSIQAQVVNLLKDLQKEQQLTYLFIAHDLSMVKYISDRIAVMYLGDMVELAATDELYNKPLHPYSEALLSAVPIADPEAEITKNRIKLEGELPSPINPPVGCKFSTRCRYADETCMAERPKLREIIPGRLAACHYAERFLDK
ncbi:ABC transporter ATP-binding protein [Haliovirga abyssi]|uniref:ABC transporter ATP-binding protein n=1 Tax=Haliovirga abyssi TaxID=2996794 RepID=A0AAU9DIN0_9FUSO|nr:oligopeptide/dipeptide ABC transporter ATP-binding protein [Haliovirga abyssi]BDU49647.1 ABC transporter ATP-binding protein [Haliovirga abyssi]